MQVYIKSSGYGTQDLGLPADLLRKFKYFVYYDTQVSPVG